MENCNICNSDYKKVYKSDHLKSTKHLQKINQYSCKKCNTIMPLSDKSNHLNSDEHKTKPNNNASGVKIVVNTLVIKQDISKVKFTR